MNAVELRDVEVGLGGRLVLSDLALSVGEHERVAVLGRNGVGKSTLLDVMLGLCTPQRGAVRVLEHSPPAPDVGFVPQDPGASLFPWLSVADNIVLPLRIAHAGPAAIAAALAEIVERIDPHHTLELDVPATTLSLGQRQLAALLRAMITRPRLLLCDEPFSALDAESREHLRKVLLSTTGGAEGPALVFVTHEPDDVQRLADRSVVLVGRPARLQNSVPGLTEDRPAP